MGNCLCPCLRENLSPKVSSIYDITMKDINQNVINFTQYQNKVLLIVNIACKWQLAGKNFDQLVMLDTQYRSRGLEILAFPCNQFFWREYGTAAEIISYTQKRGVNFKIFEMINVNGKRTCELYRFLRKTSQLDSKQIGLNFGKFLVDRNGNVFKYYGPLTNPLEFVDDIEKLL